MRSQLAKSNIHDSATRLAACWKAGRSATQFEDEIDTRILELDVCHKGILFVHVDAIIDGMGGGTMAAVSVRDLDDDVKERLRIRAAENGRSMEAEIRAILITAVNEPEPSEGLLSSLLNRFAALDGIDLDLPPRAAPVRAADFAS